MVPNRILRSLVALSVLGVGCAVQQADEGTAGQSALTAINPAPTSTFPKAPPIEFADPNVGIIGRGFNQRLPLTRVYFNDAAVSAGGGWDEAAEPDRALCVDFDSYPPPTNSGVTGIMKARLTNSTGNFQSSSNFDFSPGLAGTVNLTPIGVPVSVGANLNRGISSETITNSAQQSINVSIYASAQTVSPRKGGGNAHIRQDVLNDVLAAADPRKAFFSKCGDRYLDQVVTGGAFGLDFSFLSESPSVTSKLQLTLNDTLGLAPPGLPAAGSSQPSSGDITALLNALSINLTNKISDVVSTTINGSKVQVSIVVRQIGPAIDTTNMTIQDALDIMGGWTQRITQHPEQRAIVSAVGDRYSTTVNASALGPALPGDVDLAYVPIATQIQTYFLENYAAMIAFTQMNATYTGPFSTGFGGFFPGDPVPSQGQVNTARNLALRNMFADALALECLASVVPGSGTAAYNACLTQVVIDDGTSASAAHVRFPRLSQGVAALGSHTVNVVAAADGNGAYPKIPRIATTIGIGSPYTDLFPLLNSRGLQIRPGTCDDKTASACVLRNNNGAAEFVSGLSDDGFFWTNSICQWSLFSGLTLAPGWTVSAAYLKSPANFPASRVAMPASLPGVLQNDHDYTEVTTITMESVTFTGPLTPDNPFGLSTGITAGAIITN